jgi:CHAD domain-containing protein
MSRSLALKRLRRSDVFHAAIVPPVEALVRADSYLRARDNAESVHAARVATRKLRSDLRLFRPLLEPTWAAELRACLKRLAGLLGAVRDADVLTARVQAIASLLPAEHVAAVTLVLGRLRGARATADDALCLQLTAFWYINLLQTLIAAAQDFDGGWLAVRNDRVRARKVVARVMRPTWKRLKAAVRRAGYETDGARLHRIRIRAKACRYAAEAIGPFVPANRRDRFVHHIARLQERLGNVRDAALGEATLRALTGVDTAVVDEIVERESATAAAAQKTWRTIWKKLSCRRSRFW